MRIIVDSHIPHIRGLIEPRAEVLYLEPHDITREAVREADALIVRTRTRCNAALLDGSRVRFIGSATIGTDHLDLDYCAIHGITVRNAPGCNAPAVAQWVMAAIHAWMQARGIATPVGLTLGVVGVGHIGSIVARWARQLGFTTLLNDPPLENRDGSHDNIFSPLDELQRRCDIITFHTPLTRDGQWPTWHLCDQPPCWAGMVIWASTAGKTSPTSPENYWKKPSSPHRISPATAPRASNAAPP